MKAAMGEEEGNVSSFFLDGEVVRGAGLLGRSADLERCVRTDGRPIQNIIDNIKQYTVLFSFFPILLSSFTFSLLQI